jgi:hypothetical protein
LAVQRLTAAASQLRVSSPLALTAPPPRESDNDKEDIPAPTSPIDCGDPHDGDYASADPTSGEDDDDAQLSEGESNQPHSTEVGARQQHPEPIFTAGPMYTAGSGFTEKVTPAAPAEFYAESGPPPSRNSQSPTLALSSSYTGGDGEPPRASTPSTHTGSPLREHDRHEMTGASTPPMQTGSPPQQHDGDEGPQASPPQIDTGIEPIAVSSDSSDEEPLAGPGGRVTRSTTRKGKGKGKEMGGQGQGGTSNVQPEGDGMQEPDTPPASPSKRRKYRRRKPVPLKLIGDVSLSDQVLLTALAHEFLRVLVHQTSSLMPHRKSLLMLSWSKCTMQIPTMNPPLTNTVPQRQW